MPKINLSDKSYSSKQTQNFNTINNNNKDNSKILNRLNSLNSSNINNVSNNATEILSITERNIQDINNAKFDKQKNVLSFSSYLDRKDPPLKEGSHILSYLEPIDYTKGIKSLDFNKMNKRPEHGMANMNNVPTICYYKPNYEYLLKRQKTTKFSNEKVELSKQFLIKKMWRSYDVTSDYKLVQIAALTEKNKLQ